MLLTSPISFPNLGITVDPSPVAFTIFGKEIYWYGIIIACGFLLAVLYMMYRANTFGLTQDDVLDLVLWAVPIGVVCARLYYCVFYWDLYRDNPISMLYIWEGGLAIYGGIIGGALVEYFAAMLTDNTIDAARLMADEGDRLLSIPGVLEGTVKPDYNRMIKMATQEALRRMLIPSVLALLIPVIGGFVFGVQFVGGLLVGATIVAIPRAIFMGNSGGAFDNAKKYIEGGFLEGHGKKSPAHKAAVTGDTVGDTRKDVVGVALDIFIKTMSTIANTLVSVFSHFTLLK